MTSISIDKISGGTSWDISTGITSNYSTSTLTYPQQTVFPFISGPYDETQISTVYFFFSNQDCSLIIKSVALPPIPTQTPTISLTPSNTPPNSPTQTKTPTNTPTPTKSMLPSATPTISLTSTSTPTLTPTNTVTNSPTVTQTRTPTPSPSLITGTIDAILTGTATQGGPVNMIITFDNPLPGDIIYQAGFDEIATSVFVNTSNEYPPPRTYSNGGVGCGITATGVPAVISIGLQSYSKLSTCSEFGAPYGYVSKVVFFNVTVPSGYSLVLTPVRSNMTFEIR